MSYEFDDESYAEQEQETTMSTEEAARLGGEAVLEEYGHGFYKYIGRKGGAAVLEKYGTQFYSDIAAQQDNNNDDEELLPIEHEKEEWWEENQQAPSFMQGTGKDDSIGNRRCKPINQLVAELNQVIMEINSLMARVAK